MSAFTEDLIQSLGEAIAHARGDGSVILHSPVVPRVVRKQINLTQAQMASLMGMSLSGYRKWEQGTRRVSGVTATFLRVIEREPEAVKRAILAVEEERLPTKKLIAIWGAANSGKTRSIRNTYQMLKAAYPDAEIERPWGGKIDIARVFTLSPGFKVGIESQGDPTGHGMRMLMKSLPYFAELGCRLIICATRTMGKTVEEVKHFSGRNGYEVEWIEKRRLPRENLEAGINSTARKIFGTAQTFLASLQENNVGNFAECPNCHHIEEEAVSNCDECGYPDQTRMAEIEAHEAEMQARLRTERE